MNARLDAFGKGALVIVGGLVAIGVADDGLLAIAAGPAGLLDDAVAGGNDRRSDGGCPIDAGVHAGHSRGSDACGAPKPERNLPVGQRVAQQELLGAAAVFVEIVDAAVLHLEAVEVARRAAECRRDIEQFGIRPTPGRRRRAARKARRCGPTGLSRDWKSTSEARSLTSCWVSFFDMP